MKPPCEIVSTQILPSLRALIAKELLENKGMNQQEVAECLGLTQPAISQYRRELRGYKVKILTKDRDVYLKITEISNKLAEGMKSEQVLLEFCNLCKMIRKKGLLRELHKKTYSLKECNICK